MFYYLFSDCQVTYKQSIGFKSTSLSSKHIANAATLKLTGFISHRAMRTKDVAG